MATEPWSTDRPLGVATDERRAQVAAIAWIRAHPVAKFLACAPASAAECRFGLVHRGALAAAALTAVVATLQHLPILGSNPLQLVPPVGPDSAMACYRVCTRTPTRMSCTSSPRRASA
jgi:hypothetical protein